MIATTCPHCQKKLKLSAKIEEGLKTLPPGKSVRISCPQCTGTIVLDAGILSVETSAKTDAAPMPRAARQQITPPPPPDLTNLTKSTDEGIGIVEDVPKVLILMPDSVDHRLITVAYEALGYQPFFAHSAEDAMEKMQFVSYAGVVHHSHYEGPALDKGVFHRFMRAMNMNKRRYIFYILVGPEFNTLYDLQALAYSANLVVNDHDLPQLSIILRKTIPQYEGMFGAIMKELSVLGR